MQILMTPEDAVEVILAAMWLNLRHGLVVSSIDPTRRKKLALIDSPYEAKN